MSGMPPLPQARGPLVGGGGSCLLIGQRGMNFDYRSQVRIPKSGRGIRLGDWGLGTGDWGMGNGEWGMGNGEWGMGNGEWGMGNGEWGMGRESPPPDGEGLGGVAFPRARGLPMCAFWGGSDRMGAQCLWGVHPTQPSPSRGGLNKGRVYAREGVHAAHSIPSPQPPAPSAPTAAANGTGRASA